MENDTHQSELASRICVPDSLRCSPWQASLRRALRNPERAPSSTARKTSFPFMPSLRFSTLIVLPDEEEILDFTTGDREFWIINGSHNLCYVHPAQAGIRSNLNLITASGHVYSFLLTEISSDATAQPDLKLFIEPKEGSAVGTVLHGYVHAADAEAYRKEMADLQRQTTEQVRAAQARSTEEINQFRSSSRGARRPGDTSNLSLQRQRAQGRPGTGWCPWSACRKKARGRTTGSAEDTGGLPCAMVLRLIRALPGDHAWLPPSPADPANLAPASERQNHTISPSAAMSLVVSTTAASTASHPAFRDDRDTPLVEAGCRKEDTLRCEEKADYFSRWIWTGTYQIDPARELRF